MALPRASGCRQAGRRRPPPAPADSAGTSGRLGTPRRGGARWRSPARCDPRTLRESTGRRSEATFPASPVRFASESRPPFSRLPPSHLASVRCKRLHFCTPGRRAHVLDVNKRNARRRRGEAGFDALSAHRLLSRTARSATAEAGRGESAYCAREQPVITDRTASVGGCHGSCVRTSRIRTYVPLPPDLRSNLLDFVTFLTAGETGRNCPGCKLLG